MKLHSVSPPTILRISDPLASPNRLLPKLPHGKNLFYLDSSSTGTKLCRSSYLGWDPFLILDVSSRGLITATAWNGDLLPLAAQDPFEAMRELLDRFSSKCHADDIEVPIMCGGGAVGLLSYDLRCYIENFQHPAAADLEFPLLRFGFYDSCVVFDHEAGDYLISARDVFDGRLPASERADAVREALFIAHNAANERETIVSSVSIGSGLHPVAPGFESNISRGEYKDAVSSAIEHIRAGDIFQVNLSHRFQGPVDCDPRELYREVRNAAAAPFGAYLELPDTNLLCASPERFLKVNSGIVETRPIKGTRPRGDNEQDDQRLISELRTSAKETSENVMIVDVERNDLGRVCEIGSVDVPRLLAIESFSTVHHLVSEVTGVLREDADIVDLIKAAFPGGSISGAPKIRAMEIIDELELHSRGPYTGSLGYIDYAGNADLNIIIRTLLVHKGIGYLQVGGGIVADSDPEAEYEETILKASAIFQAISEATKS